jgi:tetratricopeptide (TPR) repeat protein
VKALELDPTSAVMLQGAAQRFYEARQYTRAVALARIAVRLDPLYPYTYSTLGFALIEQGDYGQAADAFDKLRTIGGSEAATRARRAYVSSRAGDGRSAKLAADVRGAGTLTFADRALLALAEHDDGAAVAALTAAVDTRAPPSIWLAVDPTFQPLRKRADFRSLLARVGLPEAGE